MPRVKLSEKINSGGFGEVFRATIVEDGRRVAVKRLTKPYTLDDARRFAREVRIMSRLDHPNIVKVLLSKLEADPPIFVMPLAECNLQEILPELQENEERRKLIFEQILAGMQHAHENLVIHRDLKPQNILILKGDRVAIADFGLGRFLDRDTTTLTTRGDQFGTLLYTAPEQFVDFSKADARSDIYALGKTLYQMITSRPIFPTPDLIGLDGRYVYILQKCLNNDPDKRYQSVKELAEDFILLAQRQYKIESPTEAAQKLIAEAVDPFTDLANSRSVTDLMQLLHENSDSEDLYVDVLPRLPQEIIAKMISSNFVSFARIFQVYDGFVSGSLAFEYCDVVADFYKRVYESTEDFNIKKTIIVRLLNMGASHSRWYVRDVLATIFSGIKDTGLARLALDACREDPTSTEWSNSAMDMNSLHPLLREGIRRILKPPPEEEEIPF